MHSRSIQVPHQDPADRFIAASAQVYGLTRVTADEQLLAGKGYKTLAQRGASQGAHARAARVGYWAEPPRTSRCERCGGRDRLSCVPPVTTGDQVMPPA